MDVRKFLKQHSEAYDLIFLDPPYAMPHQQELLEMIQQRQLLAKDGLMVLEHRTGTDYTTAADFQFTRIYGDSSLSFFFSA